MKRIGVIYLNGKLLRDYYEVCTYTLTRRFRSDYLIKTYFINMSF